MTDYQSITKEEVWAVAKKYLVNEKAAVLVVRPKSDKG